MEGTHHRQVAAPVTGPARHPARGPATASRSSSTPFPAISGPAPGPTRNHFSVPVSSSSGVQNPIDRRERVVGLEHGRLDARLELAAGPEAIVVTERSALPWFRGRLRHAGAESS